MDKVVTLGEILVEIVSSTVGDGFRETVPMTGPYPSGAPAIFIDQVAKLGQPCGIIGAVGADDFGWVNLDRLSRDGVDVAAVSVVTDKPTGSAFVRYAPDGSRRFVFNIADSAAGQLSLTASALRLLDEAAYLHISGASLFSDRLVGVARQAVDRVKANGGRVSFDPNLRAELMTEPAFMTAMRELLASSDIALPSREELAPLTGSTTPVDAARHILSLGPSSVVVKDGSRGATYYDSTRTLTMDALRVTEVDPTGAGDCFDAAYVTCQARGASVEESLAYACAAGARAVTLRGPMEGTSTFAQLDELRERSKLRAVPAARPPLPALPVTPGGGTTAVCSAHPLVIEAAMREALDRDGSVLIEATCNQVNQYGGYSGMLPSDFVGFVHAIAQRCSFPVQRICLGGDHLGPSPWRHLPAAEAMAEAEAMVAAFAKAGFRKLHLDASMGCAGEPPYVPGPLAAERAARLAAVAETASAEHTHPVFYVIGTEVPTPGGAEHRLAGVEVTTAARVQQTLEEHRAAFGAAGVARAYDAVVAVVAQPGVEFDDRCVHVYDPGQAAALRSALSDHPWLTFEIHSTDYQPAASLAALVGDGFRLLKVGPALTYAMRQALYGLDRIAGALRPEWAERALVREVERAMLADPRHWRAHYRGPAAEQAWLRHFSLSDRLRYYWSEPALVAKVDELFALVEESGCPELVREFLPTLAERAVTGQLRLEPRELVVQMVEDVLRAYAQAGAEGQ